MTEILPAETQTLYAELLERLLAESTRKGVSKAPGTFTTKRVKGQEYAYFQYSEPGGKTRQLYIGRAGPAVDALIGRFNKERPDADKERKALERLASQVLLGGAWSMGPRAARVLKAFTDAGVFEAGAVLVGTHAFGTLGNLTGMRLAGASLRTDDLDLAAISLLAASDAMADAEDALERLQMGFLPVPALDPRHASTSFKVRGESLRVDFLTPGRGGAPRALPALGTYAQPLPYMDYLIENPQKAAVPDAGGFLVNAPSPARFALHKVIVASERGVSQQVKAAKDLHQAAQLIEGLAEARPGDLRLAHDALRDRGWLAKLERGTKRLAALHPAAGKIVAGLR